MRLGLRRLPLSERVMSWLGPIALGLIALGMRLHRITNPRCLMFDETYYPSDAKSLYDHGVEGMFSANVLTCEGKPSTNNSYLYPAHPPLGKWVLGIGEQIWGFNPLGWRFMSAVLGSLCVVLVARIGRRLTGSTMLGCLAGLLVALDGLEFVLSRTGILDIFVLFWLLCALACLLADREQGRARLAAAMDAGGSAAWPGPKTGVRWWRVATGACLGALVSTKWSGLPFLVLFAALAIAWDAGARRVAGVRAPVRAALWRDGKQAVAVFALIPIAIYTASFTGYFATHSGWDRGYHTQAVTTDTPKKVGTNNGPGIIATARAWWHYHYDVLCFHENLENDHHTDTCTKGYDAVSHHPYESKPFGWLVLARPVLFAYDGIKDGERTADAGPDAGQVCHAHGDSNGCSRTVLAVGTPALWWIGLAALLVTGGIFVARRDWRAGLLGMMFLAAFTPWLLNTERVMFLFYALPIVPIYALSIALVGSYALGGPRASPTRRTVAACALALVALLVLINFAWLRPVLAGDVIPYHEWSDRVIGTWGFPGWL